MRYLSLLALLAAIFLATGCGPKTEAQKHEESIQFRKTYLPTGAKNFRELGNDWYYFEIELEGKTRKMLFRRSFGGANSQTECATELSE